MRSRLFWLAITSFKVVAAASPNREHPKVDRADSALAVELPSGIYIGQMDEDYKVEKFNGIPYAHAPRLSPPLKLANGSDIIKTPEVAPACPQRSSIGYGSFAEKIGSWLRIGFLNTPTDAQEECLSVSVHRPAGTKGGDKLPVYVFLFGGAFEAGATQLYDGTVPVSQAKINKQPYIWVAINYRLGAFGFMGGKELKAANSTNLGLRDQRAGLEWIADNIEAFGGDPDHVTLSGQSAGAISAMTQMVMYDGEAKYNGKPLFHAAYLLSGSLLPLDPVDCDKAQNIYDTVVKAAGCAKHKDTLSCLRNSPDYNVVLNAARSTPDTSSYRALALSYIPRPDGQVLLDSPHKLFIAGKYPKIPMILSEVEDEGTIFVSALQSNLTTTDKIVDYLSEYYFTNAPRQYIKNLVDSYPPDAAQGSPYRTGNKGDPALKRLSSMLGDIFVTAPRRVVLDFASQQNPDIPYWTNMESFLHGSATDWGTFHASDLVPIYSDAGSDFLVNYVADVSFRDNKRNWLNNFVYNFDPNKGIKSELVHWPQYHLNDKRLLWTSAEEDKVIDDERRRKSFNVLSEYLDQFQY